MKVHPHRSGVADAYRNSRSVGYAIRSSCVAAKLLAADVWRMSCCDYRDAGVRSHALRSTFGCMAKDRKTIAA